jgi:hypothetical protein
VQFEVFLSAIYNVSW